VGLYIFYYTLLCYSSRTLQTPSQARASRPKCVHMYICTQVSSMRIYVFICMSVYIFIYINVSEKIPRTISCTFHELYHLYVTADEACKFHELCLLHIHTLCCTYHELYQGIRMSRTLSSTYYALCLVPHELYQGIQMSRTLSFTYHKIPHELYPVHITNSIIHISRQKIHLILTNSFR